jgi:hypothetical protein
MKTSILPLGLAILLCSCNLFGPRPQYTSVKVPWGSGYTYLPNCKTLVEYQGKSFKIQGVSIPVPQLGGSAQIGGVSLDPQVLNQAYQTTQTLDTSYHSTCALLPALVTDKEKYQAAVQSMVDTQNKLAQLAIGIQSAQKASSTTPAPAMVGATRQGGAEPPAPAEGPGESVKEKAIKETLNNWVAAYSKKSKEAVVKAPVKPNTDLGIPPAVLPKS